MTMNSIMEKPPKGAVARTMRDAFRAIFTSARIGIVGYLPTGKIIVSNRAFRKMLGFSASELLRINMIELALPEDAEREYTLRSDLLAHHRNKYEIQGRYSHKLGQLVRVNISCTVVHGDPPILISMVENLDEASAISEAIRRERGLLQKLIDESSEVFSYEQDVNRHFLHLSPSVQNVLGYAREELLGHSYEEFLVEASDLDTLKGATENAFRHGQSCSPYVVNVRHRRGYPVTLETMEMSLVRNEATIIAGFARDITQQMSTEERLLVSEDILRTIDNLVLVADSGGLIIFASPSVSRVLFYSRERLLGYGWWNISEESPDAQLLACQRAGQLAAGQRDSGKAWEQCLRDVNGSEHWILWEERRGPGDIAIYCGLDVTERVRTRQAQLENEQRFQTIFEASMDAMLLYDDSLQLVEVNNAACVLLGKIRSALVGSRLENPKDLTPAPEQQTNGTNIARRECVIAREDGVQRVVEFVNTLHVTPGLHLSVVRDVTDRKELQEQLLHSQKMEAVGRLAGGVSHDINNMLLAIRGYAELLARKIDPSDPLNRYANSIKDAADRSSLITQQLLAFSHKQVVKPRVIAVNDLIHDVMKLLQKLIGEDIRLTLSLSPKAGLIRVDPGQFGQILMNLAVNARDAMPEGGDLQIQTSSVRSGPISAFGEASEEIAELVLITVADEGCGIPPENLEHIFEPFFTTKEIGKGTGLGLATVYGIIQQHRGAITVDSEPGKGSRFQIYFPKIPKEMEFEQDREVAP